MRKIKVAVTLDSEGGVAFNKRRQSRDRNLIADLCEKSDGYVYVSHYSAPLFSKFEDKIRIVDRPLADCPDGELAFVECENLTEHAEEISELTLYLWNRDYPSDVKLGIDLEASFALVSEYEFVGSSHERITKKTYKSMQIK